MPQTKRPMISVIIKALNEERHIAAAIESALVALEGIDGEVILADSLSTDRTVAIAKQYPIRIVRLDNEGDRSCGAGGQLGFQYSGGRYICLMDGDMRLHPGFLAAGLHFLEQNPAFGGVGGAVVDREVENLEYEQRAKRFDPDRKPGEASRLNGSGLYRRSAVETVGYVTDRNLHGGEELDLAARLQARGWKLARIECHAIDHYVHSGNAYKLLLRRMRSLNALGPGEVLRAAIGRPHLGFVLRNDRNIMLSGLIVCWWLTIVGILLLVKGWPAFFAIAAIGLLPFVIMTLRWGSLNGALYSVVVWNVFTLCFLPGFLRRRKPPRKWMASTVVKDLPAV